MQRRKKTLKALLPVMLVLTAAMPRLASGAERVVLGELHTAYW